MTVNSLHSQGVARLADGVTVEAIADDGLVEAFIVDSAPGYTLAVQWHPEWQVTKSDFSMAIFQSFGDACRDFARDSRGCSVSDTDTIQAWLAENEIDDVEAFVPDMAGVARGKVLPADTFGSGELKLPEGIFAQTVSGDYAENKENVEDRDMILTADPDTIRPVPWASDPCASVFMNCQDRDGAPVETSPRYVLQKVLRLYEDKGWYPVVAPEVEFYLINPHADANFEVQPPEGRLGWTETSKQPYSIDGMNDFDPFINDVYAYCEAQNINIDTMSQEMGPAQFEINFMHGNAVDLADQVLLFKRTVREVAIKHEMHATFLARPMSNEAGSALHIHQSIIDKGRQQYFFETGRRVERTVRALYRRAAALHAGSAPAFRSLPKLVSSFSELLGVAGEPVLGGRQSHRRTARAGFRSDRTTRRESTRRFRRQSLSRVGRHVGMRLSRHDGGHQAR